MATLLSHQEKKRRKTAMPSWNREKKKKGKKNHGDLTRKRSRRYSAGRDWTAGGDSLIQMAHESRVLNGGVCR
jgi:hypothetical protein